MTHLPDVELVAAQVHEAWRIRKVEAGILTRKAEDGEELMVPYEELSEKQKDMDRQLVLTVYAAIDKASKVKAANPDVAELDPNERWQNS